MEFQILKNHRCIIGEGPVWNEKEQRLYFTNVSGGYEMCIFSPETDELHIRSLPLDVSAYAFSAKGEIIISHAGGVDILNDDSSLSPLYDKEKYKIDFANDMKVGPDGAIYVGTQSRRRKGLSDDVDGRLYRISSDGKVKILIEGLLLSNGMDWSIDESRFYHADTDTEIIKEYFFDKKSGDIEFTGRQVCIPGVDGFTIGLDNRLYIGCWGKGYIAVVDTETMQLEKEIKIPAKIPTSCCFMGKNPDILAITTASRTADIESDENAGFTMLTKVGTKGRLPYLFG